MMGDLARRWSCHLSEDSKCQQLGSGVMETSQAHAIEHVVIQETTTFLSAPVVLPPSPSRT